MGIRRDESKAIENVYNMDVVGTPASQRGDVADRASLRQTTCLIGAIEDLTAVVAEHLLEPEPLTAEASIEQTEGLLEMLRRKQTLIAERKARVSKENPPRESADEEADG